MHPDLQIQITDRLVSDFGMKQRGKFLRGGKCPSCGEKTLWTHWESPWVLKCDRLNECRYEDRTRELFPEFFENWSERYKSTEERPHAAAEAYLEHGRGFPLARLHGLFSQEWYQDRERGIGSATVRFPLACGSWWERIIDRPERFKKKANFAPGKSYAGHWWAMPDSPADAGEIWIVEGIFDAIALELAGKAARSVMSCVNYPDKDLATLAEACKAADRARPVLVWALDGDPAGRKAIRDAVTRATADGWTCKAALASSPEHGKEADWNKLHLRGKLTADDFKEYLYEGALLLAPSAQAKALLIYRKTGKHEFHLGHGNRLWWFKLDLDKYNKARQAAEDDDLSEDEARDKALENAGCVKPIANCYPRPLYFQAAPLTDESWYFFRIEFPDRRPPAKATFTAGQVASAPEFKKRLLHVAPGALFSGTTQQLDQVIERASGIKTVETLDYVGYSREHGCYVFGDVAVKDGQIYRLNGDEFFDMPKLSIKTLNKSVNLAITRDRHDYRSDWLDMLWRCYGPKGILALAFWFGSLFAEQIRASQKSYPFLEVIGEAGAGKTTLVEFCWKLLGRRDYEGFDPSKSTLAARARNFAQVSNLPVVLIEGDRSDDKAKQRAFDWNELKSLYNGRSVRSTGVKNGGNETHEPPFRGSIVIAQNAEVSADDAVLQRIVHLRFDKSGHTRETKLLAEQLERMPLEQVSHFALKAAAAERTVMEIVEANVPAHEERLIANPDIKSVRIAKNHAQMAALVDALQRVLGLTAEQHAATQALIEQCAVERQIATNLDHPHVIQFWEIFEHLDSKLVSVGRTRDGEERADASLDHSRDPAYIAISLVELEERATKAGIRLPTDMTELKRLLRTSRARRFEDVKTVNSKVTNASKKCWVFKHAK